MTRSKALQELGLSPTSSSSKHSAKDLKAAYRKRSLETHPDKGGTPEAFIRVAQAYEFLTDKKDPGAQDPADGAGGFSSSTMSPEEQMKWAEEMFDHFADLLDDTDATADAMVDWLFDSLPGAGGTDTKQLSWGARRAKSVVQFIARRSMRFFMSMLEGDNVTINIQGQQMTGKQFQQKRKVHAQQRKEQQAAKIHGGDSGL
jgi:curved DNA-binding protein CbpA